MTTGHEWNGITELNTPVPRPVYIFLAAAALFAVVYWVLMPAWPTGASYTKGLLGFDQRAAVADRLRDAAAERSVWTDRIARESFQQVLADPALMTIVRETGHRLFGDNCAACHGRDAQGNRGFPNLTTSSWLWGGSPEAIAETIRVGINSGHPDSRTSQMLAFGRDGMLPRTDIEKVVAYVKSLSDPAFVPDKQAEVAAGQAIFAANCASCHGEHATGNPDLGTPNLTDKFWIYGGEPDTIFQTVWSGRQGWMPTWESRLSEVERKILALYVFDLRRSNQ
jgi:cytochrome c oxidase cbb3-type subunit 3